MYDEYFEAPGATVADLPYLEGDYWTGEAENIVKELRAAGDGGGGGGAAGGRGGSKG
ncbi:unnamed protein product, partial [Heterosigma akashiwo]